MFGKKKIKKRALKLPQQYDEEFLRLFTRMSRTEASYNKNAAIVDKRALWTFVATVFPDVEVGSWCYEIPSFTNHHIMIKEN